MKKILIYLCILFCCVSKVNAQYARVQNKPYTDLRPFHLGVLIGTHAQDIELRNVGLQQLTFNDGTTRDVNVAVDQDCWDIGFHVGVLGEVRLSTHLQLRVAPTMYFGTRHITFVNNIERDATGNAIEQRQDLKTAYISTATDLILSAPRVNNYRPYIVLGINPMINLSGKESDFIKLKRYDAFFEIGVGCDLYLPFFKLRPELKFMYSLINSIDTKHINRVTADNMIPYTNATRDARTKIIALSFYFE